MMLELYKNGPFPLAIWAEGKFLVYKEGIYFDDSFHFDLKDEYYTVSHSVLLVGWGEENGVKYWKILNSWGKTWGENGFGKIRRGNNEIGVECSGEAVIIDRVV